MKKIKLSFYILFSCISYSIFAQELDWLKNSTSNDVFTSHQFYAAAQHNDDFYFAGDFWKDLTIDGQNISISDDIADGFILRMDATGTASALWHLRSTDYVRINQIAVNPVSGALIATGNYRNNLIYDGQVWTTPFFSNGFVMSIRADGTVDWFKDIITQNNASFASGEGLAIDEAGNIFVGIEAGGTVAIDSTSWSFGTGTVGTIITKLDVNGTLIAIDQWKSESFEAWIDIIEMAVGEENQLIVTGCVLGTMQIADTSYVFSPTSNQPFIVKQDKDLNFQWLKTFPGMRSHILDVHIDETKLVLSLQYNEFIDLGEFVLNGSGSWGDMAIICLDENAGLKWAKNFVLAEDGGNAGVYGFSIAGWRDQYYIGGMYQGDVVHEGAMILNNSPSVGTYQYPFLLSLNQEGTLTSIYDFVGSSEPGKISCISANASYLLFGGDFSGQVSIGDAAVSTINSALFYGALTNEITGIEVSGKKEHALSVYPTLTTDILNILTREKIESISLFSPEGRLLGKYPGDTRRINVSNLTMGVYYLCAKMDGKIMIAKFVKK